MSKFLENIEKAKEQPLDKKKLLNIYEASVYTGRGVTALRKWLVDIGARRKYGSRSLYDKEVIDKAIMLEVQDNVNHPAHYRKPGHRECIDEMLDLYGREKVMAFCELNAFKYRYRADLKGKHDEDLEKASWYERKLEDLKGGVADA